MAMSEEPCELTPHQPDVIPDWLRPGSVICARFEVKEHLGTGTVGRAFLASDRLLNEEVVIKVSKQPAPDGVLVGEEYRALRSMRSPVLPVPIGYFEHETEGATWPVLVIDFVEGQPFERWAAGQSGRDRIGALAELAEALGVLTASPGGRHGDLWQGNVLVTKNGRVRLIDPDGDSLGRSSNIPGVVLRDVGAFCSIARGQIAAPDDRVVTALLDRLEFSNGAQALADAAWHLRAYLLNPLPSEVAESVPAVAPALKAARAERQATYRRIRDARDLAFRGLIDSFDTLLRPLDCTLVDPGPGAADPYKTEVEADGNAKGKLVHRHQQFIAPDGEELFVRLDGNPDFTKPWPIPERSGILSKGHANVVAENKPVATQSLELGFSGEMPQFYVVEGNRYALFDQSRLDRTAKILVGVTLPALASPWLSQAQTIRVGSAATRKRLEPFAAKLGLALDTDSLAKNWLHVMLAVHPQVGQGLGSQLTRVFEVSFGARLSVVQSVGAVITAAASDLFVSIYRIDVTEINATNRTLTTVVEAQPVGEVDVTWTFDLTFSIAA
jgi:hypothetical protein